MVGRHVLPDYLVRAQQQRLRDRETERVRGLEVKHQLELRRLLDGRLTLAMTSTRPSHRSHLHITFQEACPVHRGVMPLTQELGNLLEEDSNAKPYKYESKQDIEPILKAIERFSQHRVSNDEDERDPPGCIAKKKDRRDGPR